MRRVHIFLIILTVALGILLSLVAISLYLSDTIPSYYQSSWMNQMWQSMGIGNSAGSGNNGGMGGMMGGNSTETTNLWIIPITIIAVAIVGVLGFSFYLVLPEIRNTKRTCDPAKNDAISLTSAKTLGIETPISNVASNSCDVILKTMTAQEQKVLTLLIAHQGRYLQKYVGKEAGLSRLKTHRIVARFAERGIVTVKPMGNSNEVTISDWVIGSKAQSTK